MAAVSNRKKFSRTRGKEVLRYPLKMFAEGTDYLQIDMLDYVPVGQSGVNQKTKKERDKMKKIIDVWVKLINWKPLSILS